MATVEETPGSELAALHIDANAETEQTIPVPVDAIGKLVQCPICMGILKETRTISACMHRFCKNCIEAWLRTDITNTCPQCREGFASRRDCKPDPRFDDLLRAILGNDLAAAEALFDPQAESLEKAKALGNVLASQRQAQKVAAQRMAAKARAASVPINAVTPVNGNGETNVASMPSHKRPASGTGDGSTKRRKGGRQTPNTARSLDSQEPEEIAALNPTVPHHVSQNHAAKARATAAAAARAEKTVEENQRGYLIAMKLAEKYPDKDALGPRAPNSAAIMELRPTGILIDNPVLAWRRRFVLCPADLTLQLLAEAIVAGLKDQWQADLMTEIEMNSKFREQESLLSSLQKAPLSATLYLASEVDGTADFGEVCHVPDTQTGAMALKGGVKVRDLMYMLADCGEDLVLEYSLVVGASG